MNKIISYIGFAIKAKKIIIGQGKLKTTLQKIYLILVSKTASKNLKDLAQNVANKHNCQLIITNCELSTLTNLNDIKIIGITDENLANAILKEKEKLNIG